MATTKYFDEEIIDQGEKTKVDLQVGTSTYYSESSIYLKIDGKFVVMNRDTAKRLIDSFNEAGISLCIN